LDANGYLISNMIMKGILRYKARLVAQGYSQIPGMDYFEMFVPVVHHDSFQAILAIAAI